MSPTTASAASYAYRPSHDPRNYPHYSLNDLPNNNSIPSPSVYSSSSVSSLAQTMSTKLSMTDNSSINSNDNKIQLPSWTNNTFPNALSIRPAELASWITNKDNPPSVLLVDVRTRELFNSGCIKNQWILQIEPAALQKEYSEFICKSQMAY